MLQIYRARMGVCVGAFLGLLTSGPLAADPLPSALLSDISVPLPPEIRGLVALPQTYSGNRRLLLATVHEAAQRAGIPADLVDAVVHVESRYNSGAVGGVGEVGLMQVRPGTALMLGHKGGVTALFVPETNIQFGVSYLARAWQLANGDLCRTLMKYRAGWGEERMSPLSEQYCERAREHLAAIGSPLGAGAIPGPSELTEEVTAPRRTSAVAAALLKVPTREARLDTRQRAVVTNVELAYRRGLQLAQAQARSSNSARSAKDSAKFWAAHEARIHAIKTRVSTRLSTRI